MENPKATESISVLVARFLIRKNYELASCSGFATEGTLSEINEKESLGILSATKKEGRRQLLAIIWFENNYREASKGKWVIEILGRKNYESLFEEVIKGLHHNFGVTIEANIRENTETEIFFEDLVAQMYVDDIDMEKINPEES